jgi:alpha-tubulin suppressor-like RCC1 family protein
MELSLASGGNKYEETSVPPGLNGIIAIATQRHYSLALKDDGAVVTWGKAINLEGVGSPVVSTLQLIN